MIFKDDEVNLIRFLPTEDQYNYQLSALALKLENMNFDLDGLLRDRHRLLEQLAHVLRRIGRSNPKRKQLNTKRRLKRLELRHALRANADAIAAALEKWYDNTTTVRIAEPTASDTRGVRAKAPSRRQEARPPRLAIVPSEHSRAQRRR
jgi:hypothetical protein